MRRRDSSCACVAGMGVARASLGWIVDVAASSGWLLDYCMCVARLTTDNMFNYTNTLSIQNRQCNFRLPRKEVVLCLNIKILFINF